MSRWQKEAHKVAKYVAGAGAPYTTDQANSIIGPELEAMSAEGLHVTPSAVVDRARPEDSKLHGFLTWDDYLAAEKCRRDEARSLITNLRVVYEEGEQQSEVKAAFSVRLTSADESEDAPKQEYVSVVRVMEEPDLRIQVFNDALREIRCFAQKYSALGFKEFTPVFKFVETISK